MADADVSLEASPVLSEGGNTWLDQVGSNQCGEGRNDHGIYTCNYLAGSNPAR